MLKKHDSSAIDTAITYLKANPYCFRSGFIKASLAQLLKQCPLSKTQIKEIQDILIEAVQREKHREFRDYCKLAAKVFDDQFQQRLEEIKKIALIKIMASRHNGCLR